jgi:regulatory protein
MRITSIERPKRKRRYEVHLDNAQILPLSREVLAAADLRTGQEIDEGRIDELELAEARHTAMASAARLLSYRPRSQREMRDALRTRHLSDAVIEEAMERLTELRLLDDRAFAENWTESRLRNSPRSRRMILAELAQKGVTGEAARESVEAINDEEAAVLAGRKRLRSMHNLEFDEFRRKLGDFLGRRGFGYEVCHTAVKRLWAEICAEGEQ